MYLLGFFSYIAIEFIVDFFAGMSQAKTLEYATMNLRNALMSKIIQMNTSEYAKKNSGSYVAYMTKYVEKMDYDFFYKICRLYLQVLQFLTSVIWLFVLNWQLAIFVVIIGSIQFFVPKFLVAPTEKAQGESAEANEKYTIAIKEIFEAFDLIKSYNLQQKIEVLHKNVNKENTKNL